MAERQTVVKSKLVGKDIGNPKGATMLPNLGDRYLLGTLFGVASRITTRTMPNGDTFEGLGGTFEGIPADSNIAVVRSGVLYLPTGVFETIASEVEKEVTGTDGKVTRETQDVRFGFKVYTEKATNAAGYSWAFEPLVAAGKADMLSSLRAEILPLIAPPKTDEAPADAPKTSKK